jgi:hypothetical protein
MDLVSVTVKGLEHVFLIGKLSLSLVFPVALILPPLRADALI